MHSERPRSLQESQFTRVIVPLYRTPRPHGVRAGDGRRSDSGVAHCSAIRPPHTPAAPFGSHTAQQPKSPSKQQGRTHHVAEPGCTSSSSRGEIWMSVTGPCTSQFTSSYDVLLVE